MNNAVVTGANGFVGTWLLRELSSCGVSTIAVIKDEHEDINEIKDLSNVKIVYCELTDMSSLPDMVGALKGDSVFFHLAWAGSTGAARADYMLQLDNAKWTVQAANAAKNMGCMRFVGAGTLAEFDCGTYIPMDASTPNAVTCYGSAKIAAHYMSKAECNRLAIEHIWAYLSNTYGVGNRTQNFVNFASTTMLKEKSANFTLAEQPYDFVYVSDIAHALYCMGENGKPNYAYYIGSTKPSKLKEFIFKIRDAIDPKIVLNLGAVPFNGVELPESVFDCSNLVAHTGYQPRMSFDDGIKLTTEWLRKQIAEGLM